MNPTDETLPDLDANDLNSLFEPGELDAEWADEYGDGY